MTRVTWILHLPYPLRDALRRWRALVGMMLGVGIALGIGMTILAVSSASVDMFSADYRRSGVDLYAIAHGGTLIAILPGDTTGTIDRARSRMAEVRGIPGVRSALGTVIWSMELDPQRGRAKDAPTELFATVGVDGDPFAVPGALLIDQGRWIRRANEIVIGPRLARERSLAVGGTVRLNGRDFNIVGIGRLRGVAFNADSLAYMDYSSLRQRSSSLGDIVNIIMLDTAAPDAVRVRLNELGSFSVFDPAQLVREAQAVNASAVVIRWIMVALTLAIAGLFVSNMLLRSVAERRIEFATLRAIGIPNHTILATIAAQAVLVSVAASAIGAGLATAFGTLINQVVAPQYGFESLYAADPILFGGVFLLALSLAVASGLYPARQATRIDPALVLREA